VTVGQWRVLCVTAVYCIACGWCLRWWAGGLVALFLLGFRAAEKYKVEMPKVHSEVQNDPLRIPIP
jgi:hypothetical protein